MGDVDPDSNLQAGVLGAAAQPSPVAGADQPSRPSRRRIISITVIVLGYAALAQYTASSASLRAKTVGAVLSVAPVLLIAIGLLWWWGRRVSALLIGALSSVLLYLYWPLIERNYEWADLAEQCGIYALAALVFARSLLSGRIPLCTQLAHQMYGELDAMEGAYMRRATAGWAAFYGLMTAAVFGLFFAVSLREWSLFVNFVAWGLLVLAGFVDHALRRRLLPRHREGGILTLIRRSLAG